VTLEDVGTLRYGSEHVTVTSDATIPGSLGSFGWDDEGVPAQRDYIVRDGVLAGLQSSRESAPTIGRTSNGCMRADGWNRIPLVRMATVSLEPGTWDFDELVADPEGGLYIETNNSWSIDDKRLNFQFATEIGWEIRTASSAGWCASPTTPASRLNSGRAATICRQHTGRSGDWPAAARESPCGSLASPTEPPRAIPQRTSGVGADAHAGRSRESPLRRLATTADEAEAIVSADSAPSRASPTTASTRTWPRTTPSSACAPCWASVSGSPRPTASTTSLAVPPKPQSPQPRSPEDPSFPGSQPRPRRDCCLRKCAPSTPGRAKAVGAVVEIATCLTRQDPCRRARVAVANRRR
jgi:hypothetical protein